MSETLPVAGTVAILGQYKSGTTALFTKVRSSLPPPIRALHEIPEYIPEEEDARRWVVAKVILGLPGETDAAKYETFVGFDKKLYLVRDPRDWLVSGTLFLIQQFPGVYGDDRRLEEVLAMLREKEQDPRSHSVSAILARVLSGDPGNSLQKTADWMRRQYEWILGFENRLENGHTIKYEGFVDGRIAEMERYLGFTLHGSAQVGQEFAHVPRTRSYGNWRHWFQDEDVARFAPIFDAYLRRHGYPLDWRLADAPAISADHCSRYVERVVAMKRGSAPRAGRA